MGSRRSYIFVFFMIILMDSKYLFLFGFFQLPKWNRMGRSSL